MKSYIFIFNVSIYRCSRIQSDQWPCETHVRNRIRGFQFGYFRVLSLVHKNTRYTHKKYNKWLEINGKIEENNIKRWLIIKVWLYRMLSLFFLWWYRIHVVVPCKVNMFQFRPWWLVQGIGVQLHSRFAIFQWPHFIKHFYYTRVNCVSLNGPTLTISR